MLQAEQQAETSSTAAEQASRQAEALNFELGHIQYVDHSPTPSDGPLDTLRDQYGRLKVMYEEQVGQESLLQLARREEEQAAEHRRRLAQRLTDNLTEAQVQAFLDSLPDPSHAEQAAREAMDAWGAASNRVGQSEQAKHASEQRLKDAERSWKKASAANELPELSPSSVEVADMQAAQFEHQASEFDAQAEAHRQALSTAESALHSAHRSRDSLTRDDERLHSLLLNYEDVWFLAPQSPECALPQNDQEVRQQLERLDADLRKFRADLLQLGETRQQTVRQLRAWVIQPKFEPLKSMLAKQLADMEEEPLEEAAPLFLEELALRQQTIEAQLEKMNQHHNLLVKEVLEVAEDGLDLLRSASRQSQLPDHVPGLGGTQFLRITLHVPEDAATRRERVSLLVDELVSQGQFPSGLALAQQAVRRLARPISVKVLHPDPDLNRQTVDITELGKFSGGEQLTCAILLYCTLAQLRARSQGKHRKPTSVLLLDNPIGRASRPRFLQLQREVARAMGVQLIYTTAVHDFEALHTLPNVIRLRNERFDRTRGTRLIELPSSLEPARLHRPEAISEV